MQSQNVNTRIWVRLKKPVKSKITLDLENVPDAMVVGFNTSDNYKRVEMAFNSLMTEIFEGSITEELIQQMLAHMKTQIE